jgi:hypothetical protein
MLTLERFALDADTPRVNAAARGNKNRKVANQLLPLEVAQLLKGHFRDRPAGQPIWGAAWARNRVPPTCCGSTLRPQASPISRAHIPGGDDAYPQPPSPERTPRGLLSAQGRTGAKS